LPDQQATYGTIGTSEYRTIDSGWKDLKEMKSDAHRVRESLFRAQRLVVPDHARSGEC
jgi:hypothetical protein